MDFEDFFVIFVGISLVVLPLVAIGVVVLLLFRKMQAKREETLKEMRRSLALERQKEAEKELRKREKELLLPDLLRCLALVYVSSNYRPKKYSLSNLFGRMW